MKITILGCGGSGGVPMIGGNWGNCNPHNPKNRRRRVSVLVQENDTNILIDCGPDVREQLSSVHMTKVDAVLLTHAHADHAHGIDDLRKLYFLNGNTPIPLYGQAVDLQELHRRFDYAFKPFHYGVKPEPPLQSIEVAAPFEVKGIRINPFVQMHGRVNSLGFRIGDFAYSTDVKTLDEAAFATLKGIRVWVVDCVRETADHPAHSHLAQTLEWIARVGPRQAYLTHMDSALDYDETLAKSRPASSLPMTGWKSSFRVVSVKVASGCAVRKCDKTNRWSVFPESTSSENALSKSRKDGISDSSFDDVFAFIKRGRAFPSKMEML